MFIPRAISEQIKNKLAQDNKIIIIYGPRQAGKTTLVKKLLEELKLKTIEANGEEQRYIDVLSSRDSIKMKALTDGYELLFIDEAQKIPDIGINLKIMADHLPHLKIIATGSSSFDLANNLSEPLTGRAWNHTLYPIAFAELKQLFNEFELKALLEERLLYGSYPAIFSMANNETKREYLEQLSSAYLYKDIFELSGIKHSAKLRDLLKLLAFQIGNEVSVSEIAAALGMGKGTVGHYIDLLEKSFVVFRLSGFSRNLRKEVAKMDKIYFYDCGIRNIVIDNMKPLLDRNDVGQLWENFLVGERMKWLAYNKKMATPYFWRTYTGAEIDYVEEGGGRLAGYELKYGAKTAKPPKTWFAAYPEASFETVNPENFLTFVCS